MFVTVKDDTRQHYVYACLTLLRQLDSQKQHESIKQQQLVALVCFCTTVWVINLAGLDIRVVSGWENQMINRMSARCDTTHDNGTWSIRKDNDLRCMKYKPTKVISIYLLSKYTPCQFPHLAWHPEVTVFVIYSQGGLTEHCTTCSTEAGMRE